MAAAVVESSPPLSRTMARFLSAIAARLPRVGTWIFCPNRKCNASTRRKLRGHDGMDGITSPDEIIQDPVRHRFVERAEVAITRQIKLQRFTFHTDSVRNVVDLDAGEVSLAGDRTNRRE